MACARFVTPPVVYTSTVTSITNTTATSGGHVTSSGGARVITKGVCWSTTKNPVISLDSKTLNGPGTGSFISSLTNLTPNTTYYVRAYATNSAGTGYGHQYSFTTTNDVSNPTAPSVTTTSISAIAVTTASGGGNVTSDGGATVTVRGICWGTSQNPTISSAKTTNGTGTGSFVSSLTNLTPSTIYYVRAYATNSIGTTYGTQVSFTTLALATNVPTVTTTAMSAITSTTATSGGNVTSAGTSSVTARGVVWSTSQNPTVFLTTKTTNGTGTGIFSSSLTNLIAGTTYYVRAYATNSSGTGYGNQLTFTTTVVNSGSIFYVSTTGSDNNPGTISSPWLTLQYAFNKITAGQTLYIRTGTYSPSSGTNGYGDSGSTTCVVYVSSKHGTSSSVYNVMNYPGEYPIIDGSKLSGGSKDGILLSDCSYWHIKGIEVKNFTSYGIEQTGTDHIVLEQCICHGIGGPGFKIRLMSGDEDQFINCDSYNNYDASGGGGNADGFDLGFTSSGTSRIVRLTGCRAWDNSDDGFDMYNPSGFGGIFYLTNCWAFGQGYAGSDHTKTGGDGNGFKPGVQGSTSTVMRYFNNCVAYGNRVDGFNQNEALCGQEYNNCIAYGNKKFGFEFFESNSHNILRNNVSFGNIEGAYSNNGTPSVNTKNTWNSGVPTASSADFTSVDASQLSGARQSNGNPPIMAFLHLVSGSKLRGAGVSISTNPTDGDGKIWASPPSIGAFEY